MIRVLVADDVDDYRLLLRKMLEMDGRFSIVAEATDGQNAVDLAEQEKPDIVLLDISMPGMDGLEAIPHILRAAPGARVVMVSGVGDEGASTRSLRLGAHAYVAKGRMTDDLVPTVITLLP
ncbi:MAG: response regulator [Actinomycetota bacterium]